MVHNDKKNTSAPNHFQTSENLHFLCFSSTAAPLALTDLLLANNLEANVVEMEALETYSFSFLSVRLIISL